MALVNLSRSRGTKYLFFAAAIAAIFAVILTPSSARADDTDLPVVINMSDLSSFVDSGSNAVDIVSDTTTGTEEDISGTESSGAPVSITIYSNQPASADPTLTDLETLAGESDGGSGSTSSVTTDTSSFVPQVVTAVTPTTIVVAWVAPSAATEFSLAINGEGLPSQSTPNFTLTDLTPDSPYDLDMESSFASTTASGNAPTPPVSSACPAPQSDVSADLSSWDTSGSGDLGNAFVGAGDLALSTAGTTSASVAEGFRSVSLPLSDAGSPSLVWDGSGNDPTLRLKVDFANDGTELGTLIQDPSDHTDWLASDDTSAAVSSAAPHVGAGDQANGYGSLAEWSTAFPSAHITQFGYELGPSVQASGNIDSITLGCTEYSFETSDLPTAPSNLTDQSSYVSVRTLTPLPEGDFATPRELRRALVDETNSSTPPSVDSAEIAYRAFIPYDYLSDSPHFSDQVIVAGCVGLYEAAHASLFASDPNPLDYTFIGDNRSFEQPNVDPADRNYRTSMDYKFDWTTDTGDGQSHPGDTQLIKKSDDSVIQTQDASTDGMHYYDQSHTDDYAAVTLQQSAHDPFCPSYEHFGAITFQMHVSFYRTGLTTVTGVRFTMPSQEIWVRWNGDANWTNIMAANATDLECLVLGQADILSDNFKQGCLAAVITSGSESTDKWSTFDGSWGTTSGGHIWGNGDPSILAADDGLASGCYLPSGAVARAPALPVDVTPEQMIVSGSGSGSWVTVLGSDHHIYTWGGANDIDLGRTPTGGNQSVPTAVDDLDYKYISTSRFQSDANYGATYAVTTSGDVYAWGYLPEGPYDTSQPTETTPTLIGSGDDIAKVAAGDGTAIALDDAGNIFTYGESPETDADPSEFNDWLELPVAGKTFDQIAVDDGDPDDAWALDSDGALWYWNSNTVENASTDGQAKIASPAVVTTDATFTQIHGNNSSMTATDSSGVPYYVSSYDGPDFNVDYAAETYSVADAPPVTLTNFSTPTDTGFPNGMGIDADGNAWEYLPNSDYSVYSWVDLGLPPVRNPIPVCY